MAGRKYYNEGILHIKYKFPKPSQQMPYTDGVTSKNINTTQQKTDAAVRWIT